jgi:hypothetical protein
MNVIENLIVSAILALLAAILYLPQRACEQTAEKMGLNHDWIWGQGCMIEPKPDEWVPLKNYRVLKEGA